MESGGVLVASMWNLVESIWCRKGGVPVVVVVVVVVVECQRHLALRSSLWNTALVSRSAAFERKR